MTTVRKPQMDFSKLAPTIENLGRNLDPESPFIEIHTEDLQQAITYLNWLQTFLADRRTTHAAYQKKRNALAKAAEKLLDPDEIAEIDRQIEERFRV